MRIILICKNFDMNSQTTAAQEHPAPQRPEEARRVQLADLMGPARVLEIEHEGQIYRLSLTRQGKLILTK